MRRIDDRLCVVLGQLTETYVCEEDRSTNYVHELGLLVEFINVRTSMQEAFMSESTRLDSTMREGSMQGQCLYARLASALIHTKKIDSRATCMGWVDRLCTGKEGGSMRGS